MRARCKRKKIHAIHKANIMKLSDGLFIRCSRNISKEYPEITYGEHIVDNTCMQLVMNPYQYDMLLLENLYGDIISDLCAAFVGGLGLVPGANFGHHCAIFEAVHGSAPDIAGKDIANPTAVLRSGILMLRHLGEENAANHIRLALEKVFGERKHVTRDVGGTAGTSGIRRRHGRSATRHPATQAGVAGSGVVRAGAATFAKCRAAAVARRSCTKTLRFPRSRYRSTTTELSSAWREQGSLCRQHLAFR